MLGAAPKSARNLKPASGEAANWSAAPARAPVARRGDNRHHERTPTTADRRWRHWRHGRRVRRGACRLAGARVRARAAVCRGRRRVAPTTSRACWGLADALRAVAAFPDRLTVRSAITGAELGALGAGRLPGGALWRALRHRAPRRPACAAAPRQPGRGRGAHQLRPDRAAVRGPGNGRAHPHRRHARD